jgi:hypothetical protein
MHTYVDKLNPKIYIHTYIPTHIHSCMHTGWAQSLVDKLNGNWHTYIHQHMHKRVCTYIHTYINVCLHTYIHTYIHAYMHTGWAQSLVDKLNGNWRIDYPKILSEKGKLLEAIFDAVGAVSFVCMYVFVYVCIC